MNQDTKAQVVRWIRRYFWLPVPVVGLLAVWGMILTQQPLPTPDDLSRGPSNAASSTVPLPAVSPMRPAVSTPSPGASPGPSATQPSAGKAASAIAPNKALPPLSTPRSGQNPLSYSGKEAAINAQAKARLLDSSVDSLIEMRVAIAQGGGIVIGSSDGATVLNQEGKPIRQIAPGEGYAAGSDGDVVWVQPNGTGVLGVGNRPYRGRFLVLTNNGGTLVVNYVNLRKYLYSVVASEVSPSWNMQALKAQAIAARSYALTYYFKPVSKLYHMGSDEYYQVYSGTEKEAESTSRAVDETAGEFVSYRGGIVESLYAASDDIVAEAFEGKGMSQLGALHLANQGYNYQQILANYYPNTGVGRIEADRE
jgi:stage II sporulation protein D